MRHNPNITDIYVSDDNQLIRIYGIGDTIVNVINVGEYVVRSIPKDEFNERFSLVTKQLEDHK